MWREKQRFVERNDGATGSPDIISQKTSSVSKFDRPICFIQKNLPYFILLSTDGQSAIRTMPGLSWGSDQMEARLARRPVAFSGVATNA